MTDERRPWTLRDRILVAATTISLLLAACSVAGLVWVVKDPQRWLGAALETKGPPGDQGPRGVRGDVGPAGPVGPDANAAISELSARLDDLETGAGDTASTSVDDLSATIDDVVNGSGGDAGTSLSDVAGTVSGLCDAIGLEWQFSNSATESLLDSLHNAC